MFCVECGIEGNIYKNGVCINCYLKNKIFTKGPNVIDIFTCSSCSSYKYKNTWLNDTFEEILKRNIRDNFQISSELKKVEIKTKCDDKERNINCIITISGSLNDHKISEDNILNVRIKKIVCDVCSKQFGGYYEAILQIRANKKLFKNELEEIRLFVEKYVVSLREKGNRGLFITDVGKYPGGIDFFLSEKGPAYTIAKKIHEKFGGEIKQSSSNIGMKDSRQVYRMTYLVRLPPYKNGNFIFYKDSFYYISQIKGSKIHVIEVSKWSENIFEEKQFQKIEIIGGRELIKEMILVSQSPEEIQVMDIKNYKTFDIKKPKKIDFKSNMVKVVNLGDRYLLFPEKKYRI